MKKNKVQIISKKSLICENGKVQILAKGTKIYARNYVGIEQYIGNVANSTKQYILSKMRILQRILRYEVRTGVFIDESTVLISFHGAIYRIEINERKISKEHIYRKGMNNPLTFCKVENVEGFNNSILYGEYFNNYNKEKVCIWERNTEGEWKNVYTFAPKTIAHVHKILIHQLRNSIIVLTGDTDDESAIWEAKEEFSKFEKVVGGSQKYRSCVAMPYKNGLIYATDTPLETNGIFYLDMGNEKAKVNRIAEIAGPAIYGSTDKFNRMWFSTSVEPDSRLKPYLKYMVSYKLGAGVKDRFSHIYCVDEDKIVNEVYKAKKDVLPMLLFGFGTFLFAESDVNQIYLRAQGLRKIDGKTVILYEEGKHGIEKN